jgi:hypothetical protein
VSAVFRGVESMAVFVFIVVGGAVCLPFILLRGAWAAAVLVSQHGMLEGIRRWEP